MVSRDLEDFFLQASEGSVAFPIEERHVYLEEAEEAVRHVLLARRLSLGDPGEFLGRAGEPDVLCATDVVDVYSSGGGNGVFQTFFGAEEDPVLVIEGGVLGCEKLLQCPAAGEPNAASKGGTCVYGPLVRAWRCSEHVGSRHVGKVDDTDGCFAVPSEHGVDGLAKFGTVGFVDAAGINPGPYMA